MRRSFRLQKLQLHVPWFPADPPSQRENRALLAFSRKHRLRHNEFQTTKLPRVSIHSDDVSLSIYGLHFWLVHIYVNQSESRYTKGYVISIGIFDSFTDEGRLKYLGFILCHSLRVFSSSTIEGNSWYSSSAKIFHTKDRSCQGLFLFLLWGQTSPAETQATWQICVHYISNGSL